MQVQELQNDLAKELVNISQDTAIDIVEIGLDSLLTDEILKEIPIVKTINTFFKMGLNIRDRYFTKKLIKFINELKSEQIDGEKYIKFKENMEIDSFKQKVTERLIIIIDRLEEINKIFFISKFFKGFIEGKITWEDFCNFSKYIDFINSDDFELLRFLRENDTEIELIKSDKKELEGNSNKLIQFNFVKTKISGISPSNSSVVLIRVKYLLTNDGIKFLSCID